MRTKKRESEGKRDSVRTKKRERECEGKRERVWTKKRESKK